MSEVHRYKVVKMLSEAGNRISYDPHGPEVVMASSYDAALSQLAALREELAKFDDAMRALACNLGAGGYNAEFLTADQLASKVQWGIDNLLKVEQQRLADAERRNASIVGKVDKCKVCGSNDLSWFAQNTVPNGIQQNRLNTHDVKCLFVLGCNECSETLKLVSADTIAERMTAALNPKPEA